MRIVGYILPNDDHGLVLAVSTAYIPTCSGTSSTLLPGVTDNELQLAALLEACSSADQLNHNTAPPPPPPPQNFYGLGGLDERSQPPPPTGPPPNANGGQR